VPTFRINVDSSVPPSAQLYEQVSFAIASRQLPPGSKLPSVRQLAMQTNLHRNTISKVYTHLEKSGLVEARAGSGVYVLNPETLSLSIHSTIKQLIQGSIDAVLAQGYSLEQVTAMFIRELELRSHHGAQLIATSPDKGILRVVAHELQKALDIPVLGLPIDELLHYLKHNPAATVVTDRYCMPQVKEALEGMEIPVLPIDINTYTEEITLVEQLRAGSCLGIICLSRSILYGANILTQSMRGEELLILTAHPEDEQEINAILQSADLIILDEGSFGILEQRIRKARISRIRPLGVHVADNHTTLESIAALRKALGRAS
jgi:GntR family transcriptional regulator